MALESVITVGSASIKYGFGSTREVGFDMKELGAKRVMVVTDHNLAQTEPVKLTLNTLRHEGLEAVLYSGARVEPTDASMKEAIDFALRGSFDGFVGVGGGSSLDTAKVANLYSTYPDDFLSYVNAPIGKGMPVPGPLKPLIGIPTTAGTGSETTGVVIFDLVEMRAKTGIAHRYLKPTLGLIDPENTRTLPPMVATSTGFDVLVHALESYTNMPFDQRERPERPLLRPAYQGRNPISDLWSAEAIRTAARYLPRAVENPEDDEARAKMIMAAAFAGVGFGNAGLHLPHGMSYPVSGMARDYHPPGYPEPLIPHGISVVLNAPASFRFTGSGCPERHLQAAEFLGANVSHAKAADAGDILADQVITYMQRLKVPNGLSAVGYTKGDIPALVEGTLPQHRVIKLSPRPVGRAELTELFEKSMVIW